VRIEEEKSRTGETSHGTEMVAYLCWGVPADILAVE
jgi:hypothetical protein